MPKKSPILQNQGFPQGPGLTESTLLLWKAKVMNDQVKGYQALTKNRFPFRAFREGLTRAKDKACASLMLQGTLLLAFCLLALPYCLALPSHAKALPPDSENTLRSHALGLPENTLNAALTSAPADPMLLQKLGLDDNNTKSQTLDPDFAEALEMTLPLSPQEILRAKALREAIENASSPVPAKMCMESRNLTLIPKGVPQIVRLTQGYSSTLVFQDLTGKPWPILHTVLGNPQAFSTLQPGQKREERGSMRDSAGEPKKSEASQERAGQAERDINSQQSHMLNIVPLTSRANSNLAIALEDAPYPVIVQLICDSPKAAKRSQDALIVFRLDQKGPLSSEVDNRSASSPLSDASLAFIHNDPPSEARALITRPSLSDTRLWQLGQSIYLRTPHALVWPAWKSVANGENIRVYELGRSPSLVVAIDGKNTTLTLHEPDDD